MPLIAPFPSALPTPEAEPRAPDVAQGSLIIGRLEQIAHGGIKGWAIDRLNPEIPVKLRLKIDGSLAAVVNCCLPRPDLAPLQLPSRAIGFDFAVPPRFHDGVRHVLSFATVQGAALQLPDAENRLTGEIHFCIVPQLEIDGVLDGLVDGMVQGWALKTDRSGNKTGGLRLLISAAGQPIAEVTADQFRADVAEAGDVDPSCGFSYALPPDLAAAGKVRLEAHAMPGHIPLRQSPTEIILPAAPERARIMALLERTDELFRFAYELRRELRAALPAGRYSLADYEAWARQNESRIGPRAAARYGEIAGRPLVSILCPVFRPDPAAFCAMFDSVRAQSYGNWELVLVDDASGSAGLSQTIGALGRAEPRLRVFVRAENGGIAEASNHALRLACGEVCVFLDQDDLLHAQALEVMLRARTATGARLLYSDEDKVNHAGRFCEPNLKPDFNYRFLLELNYICHLVMVDTALARQAGGLDARFDGAQDHEFLLRLTEHLEARQIHHVAEILYHWRITPGSTAGGLAAKPQAALAGALGVAAHLARRNRPATVTRREGMSCYRVAFDAREDPGVSILIPFRDHLKMTRACIDAIRRHTGGTRYEIILLDNWSNSAEAEAFCAEQGNLPDTRIVRIAEPFNFSRINNRGAAYAAHPFLLFLNNDVLVAGEHWLRVLLNEALADPRAAAVGAKLLYPSGTIQHAGVVLGVGGVADHAFRGLPRHSPGYIAHAIAAREVAAVTAACMLVRRRCFEEVGGFDDDELGIAFNDIDLCLKLRKAGYRIIYAAECVAEHHESMSRGDDLDNNKLGRFMRENQVMLERWRHELAHDPFYNRHFARDGGIYRDLRVLEPAEERAFEKDRL